MYYVIEIKDIETKEIIRKIDKATYIQVLQRISEDYFKNNKVEVNIREYNP